MTGLLLINLGTPDEPTTPAVRRYLAEFLSDPLVIDINPVSRWLLLHLIILRTRPKKSAEAYQLVWDEKRGSPLLYHSEDLLAAVRERMGGDWQVELGMRYGSPSIASALDRFREAGVDRVVAFPLFPQYAASSTQSAIDEVKRAGDGLDISFVDPFYEHPGFIEAFAQVGSNVSLGPSDKILFSYHGLPERHVRATDETGAHCLASDECCDAITDVNRNCYRAQCYATTRALADRLGLTDDQYVVGFQSRLGRTPWIQPFTDVLLDQLAADGVDHLHVYCPAFVADCLETLEEIGMRAKEQFTKAGGGDLELVPSLNSSGPWADAVAKLVEEHLA
jgi:ferrochelatase